VAAPQPHPQPGEGFVITTARNRASAFLRWPYKPTILVNGQPLPHPIWGRNVVPAPPGQYQLLVTAPNFFPSELGPLALPPGQWLELEYRPPLAKFGTGLFGPPPQRSKSQPAVIWVAALVAFFIALIVVVLFVAF
jgi:hypothetical protein